MSPLILTIYAMLIIAITVANFILWMRFKKQQQTQKDEREQEAEKL